MTNHLKFLASFVSLGLAALPAVAQAGCDLESIRAIAPDDAVIDSVTPIDTPVAHCEVVGHMITRNPGPNRVEWTVMLPDRSFNGRFYFVGAGAAAGFVPTTRSEAPMAAYYRTTTLKLLSEGFAVAGSDTGHKGFMWEFAIDNPAAKLDHGHRGAHVSTVAAQAITRTYYNMQDKLYRYHLGCSGGGRMGAMAALHHPEDYDGIVASTGFGKGGSMWFPWIIQYLVEDPDRWISPAKLAHMELKVAELCAGPDGLVRDPESCGFDPASLKCQGESTDQCLTDPEIDMARRINGRHPVGPGETSGGFTYTNPTGWSSFLIGTTRPTNSDPANPWAPHQPPSAFGISQSILRGIYFNDADFDLLTDLDFNNEAHLQVLADHHADWGATSPDLSGFKKAGGKLILWAPLGENAVPPWTEIEYYHALKDTVAGTDRFMRLYEVPGVWHCGGGPGPQDAPDRFLDKVIAWAEQDKRPDGIVTSASTPRVLPPGAAPAPSRTVLVCPYPKRAVFTAGPGAFPYDADNWRCR